MILMAGVFFGFISTYFPWLFTEYWTTILKTADFDQEYPDKVWTRRLMGLNLLFSIIFAILIAPFTILPLFDYFDSSGGGFAFGFWFLGGVSFLDSVFETTTGLSPIRIVSMGRGGSSYIDKIAIDKRIKRFGLLHMGLIILIGIILPLLLGLGQLKKNVGAF